MPILQNQRHERFAQGLAKGLTGKAAYVEAGYTSNGNAAEVGAARLIRKAQVGRRVTELQAEAAMRSAITVDDLVAELNIMFKLALATRNPAAGVGAVMGKAKLLGLIVDKAEVASTQRKPMRQPGEANHMSLEEWQAKFVPKRVN
jgi:phage terminase small subunit